LAADKNTLAYYVSVKKNIFGQAVGGFEVLWCTFHQEVTITIVFRFAKNFTQSKAF
jgi:hypothetical protein